MKVASFYGYASIHLLFIFWMENDTFRAVDCSNLIVSFVTVLTSSWKKEISSSAPLPSCSATSADDICPSCVEHKMNDVL